jgi:hypothetical protein
MCLTFITGNFHINADVWRFVKLSLKSSFKLCKGGVVYHTKGHNTAALGTLLVQELLSLRYIISMPHCFRFIVLHTLVALIPCRLNCSNLSKRYSYWASNPYHG